MSVNRIQIKASLGEKQITIPIGQTFDEVGREQLIRDYEVVEQQDNVNIIQDYETTRYSFSGGSFIHYEFKFYSGGTYFDKFKPLGYKDYELAKNKKSFVNSFFKFDYWDSPLRKEQKLMFSIVVPANNCDKDYPAMVDINEDPLEYFSQLASGDLAPGQLPEYDIYHPYITVGPTQVRNEGYYIQWLKERNLLEINTFYMSCNFFNAGTGQSTRMINKNPLIPSGSWNPTTDLGTYDYPEWFYYQVKLTIREGTETPKYYYNVYNYSNMNLQYGIQGSSIGTLTPIIFYEYIEP